MNATNPKDQIPLNALLELDELLLDMRTAPEKPLLKTKISNLINFLSDLDRAAIVDLHARYIKHFVVLINLDLVFSKKEVGIAIDVINESIQLNTVDELDLLRVEVDGRFLFRGQVFKTNERLAVKIFNMLGI